jgi:hypothetical protein
MPTLNAAVVSFSTIPLLGKSNLVRQGLKVFFYIQKAKYFAKIEPKPGKAMSAFFRHQYIHVVWKIPRCAVHWALVN